MAITFTDEQTTRLLELIGAPADTTDVEAILAVIEDLATQAADGGDLKPSNIANMAKRHGLEAIDADTLTALRTEAAEGRQIKAASAKAAVESKVDDAIQHGKITAARRKHWVDLITADPGMADVLASVPNETAVPLNEIGHGQSSDSDTIEEAAWFR
ncbi:hypothetical protein R4227_16445 [Gordonia amicalis]|uniref:hypothetical protein n=1 Tax=Gordonia amicalis TaxID=89053 RepID=UPI0029546648|nr:hypothetical protein [Gordonia amicalis]MDV7101662.1 hypothetical protein [Gordonia amicalis]